MKIEIAHIRIPDLMRIIKANPDYLRQIAGEMLNIETSTFHYIDGVPAAVDATSYYG